MRQLKLPRQQGEYKGPEVGDACVIEEGRVEN